MRRIGIAVRVLLVIALFGWLQQIYGGKEYEEHRISQP